MKYSYPFGRMWRKILLSFCYFLFSATLLSGILFWLLSSTFLSRDFYTTQITETVYPQFVEQSASQLLSQDQLLTEKFAVTDMHTVVSQSVSKADFLLLANQLLDTVGQVFLTSQTQELKLDFTPYKARLKASLQQLLIGYVNQLPACTPGQDGSKLECRPFADTSPDVTTTYLAAVLDLNRITAAVPDGLITRLPAAPVPRDIFYLWQNIGPHFLFLPALFLLLIVLLSRNEWQSFFKKQSGLLLSMALTFFIFWLVLSEVFSYLVYSLEQDNPQSMPYLNLLIDSLLGKFKEHLLWVICFLLGAGILSGAVFLILYWRHKKNRPLSRASAAQ